MSRTLVVATAAPQFVETVLRHLEGEEYAVMTKPGFPLTTSAPTYLFHRIGWFAPSMLRTLREFRPDRVIIVCGDVYYHDNVMESIAFQLRLLGLAADFLTSVKGGPPVPVPFPLGPCSAIERLANRGVRKMKDSARFLRMALRYPRAAMLSLAYEYMTFHPDFTIRYAPVKEDRARYDENVGYVSTRKRYSIQRKGKEICSITLRDVEENNAFNFYFHRVANVQRSLDLCREHGFTTPLDRGMKIFEPGCNAGLNLLYLKDRFDVQVEGGDVSEEGIRIARQLFEDKESFHCADLVNTDFLDRYATNEFDMVYVSDHFKHITHYGDQAVRYLDQLKRIGRSILFVDRDIDQVHDYLEGRNFTLIPDGTRLYGYCVTRNSTDRDSL